MPLQGPFGDDCIIRMAFWRQRAKIKFTIKGDENTKFFHTLASSRYRKKNRDPQNQWLWIHIPWSQNGNSHKLLQTTSRPTLSTYLEFLALKLIPYSHTRTKLPHSTLHWHWNSGIFLLDEHQCKPWTWWFWSRLLQEILAPPKIKNPKTFSTILHSITRHFEYK
jgi:hypothetical protein